MFQILSLLYRGADPSGAPHLLVFCYAFLIFCNLLKLNILGDIMDSLVVLLAITGQMDPDHATIAKVIRQWFIGIKFAILPIVRRLLTFSSALEIEKDENFITHYKYRYNFGYD